LKSYFSGWNLAKFCPKKKPTIQMGSLCMDGDQIGRPRSFPGLFCLKGIYITRISILGISIFRSFKQNVMYYGTAHST
jgi:hypothetical protein